jgi:hypothetical protein
LVILSDPCESTRPERTQQLVPVRNGAVHVPPRVVLEVVPANGPREPPEAQVEAALELLGDTSQIITPTMHAPHKKLTAAEMEDRPTGS